VTVRNAFQLWCLGDPQAKFPALRMLEASDMGEDKVVKDGNSKPNAKHRRLANFAALMGELDAAIDKSHGKVLGPLDAARVNSVFDSVKDDVLLIAATTPKGRKRRVDSTMWSTIVRQRWTKGKQTAAGEQVVEMTQTTRGTSSRAIACNA